MGLFPSFCPTESGCHQHLPLTDFCYQKSLPGDQGLEVCSDPDANMHCACPLLALHRLMYCSPGLQLCPLPELGVQPLQPSSSHVGNPCLCQYPLCFLPRCSLSGEVGYKNPSSICSSPEGRTETHRQLQGGGSLLVLLSQSTFRIPLHKPRVLAQVTEQTICTSNQCSTAAKGEYLHC